MNRNQHSDEFREQALSKVRQRGTRSVRDIAEDLNMSAGPLRKWWGRSNRALMEVTVTVTAERPKVLQQACDDVLQNAHGNGPAISAAIRGRAPSAYLVGLLRNRSATCLLYHLALPVVLCPAVWSLAGMR